MGRQAARGPTYKGPAKQDALHEEGAPELPALPAAYAKHDALRSTQHKQRGGLAAARCADAAWACCAQGAWEQRGKRVGGACMRGRRPGARAHLGKEPAAPQDKREAQVARHHIVGRALHAATQQAAMRGGQCGRGVRVEEGCGAYGCWATAVRRGASAVHRLCNSPGHRCSTLCSLHALIRTHARTGA